MSAGSYGLSEGSLGVGRDDGSRMGKRLIASFERPGTGGGGSILSCKSRSCSKGAALPEAARLVRGPLRAKP